MLLNERDVKPHVVCLPGSGTQAHTHAHTYSWFLFTLLHRLCSHFLSQMIYLRCATRRPHLLLLLPATVKGVTVRGSEEH